MSTERKLKTPELETKESLVFIAVAEARVYAFLFQCPEPLCPQGDREKEQMTPAHTDCTVEKEPCI